MTASPVDQLTETIAATKQLVAGVTDDQWAQPTPCPDWTVRELVNHLVGGNRLFAEILHGDADALGHRQGGLGRDHLGDDPLAGYRVAAEELLAAVRQPGVLEQTFTLPPGRVPGIVALHLRLVETLVHGWDLAQATGQQTRFPDAIVEQELAFTRGKLAELGSSRAFAPPEPVAEDAPPIDQLAACLGRAIPGTSPPGR